MSQIPELDFYESNGLYRYSSGKFLSLDDARLRRTEVVNNGISDAFLVVFYNGKRITMQEARDLLKSQGPSVLYLKNQEVNRNTDLNISGSSNENVKEINIVDQPAAGNEYSKLTKPNQAEVKPAQKHTLK